MWFGSADNGDCGRLMQRSVHWAKRLWIGFLALCIAFSLAVVVLYLVNLVMYAPSYSDIAASWQHDQEWYDTQVKPLIDKQQQYFKSLEEQNK